MIESLVKATWYQDVVFRHVTGASLEEKRDRVRMVMATMTVHAPCLLRRCVEITCHDDGTEDRTVLVHNC
ncbi:hypothetical protein AB0E83_30790 [Streptomyces sp. NPDC035033]|uniref:hypothetical protein n=1 Tax=Streptomyces sp. NPDC035033 TaxID=3155368 RepID=UPI0033C32A1F